MAAAWTTLDDVRARLHKRWTRAEFLTAWAEGHPFEHLVVALTGPSAAELSARFDEARDWITHWTLAAREQPITLRTRSSGHRTVGANQIPSHVEISSYDALWTLLGVAGLVRRFDALRADTLGAVPALDAWMAQRPLRVLEHADRWNRLALVSRWIAERPADSSVYLREIPIPGVDTKFVEQNRAVLAALVDVQAPDRADAEYGANQFARRYGFAVKPALVRLRSLDRRRPLFSGVHDITVRTDEFSAAAPDAATVFVVENDVTFLAFPEIRGAVALFGGGFAVSSFAALPWLQDRHVVYWGDIDTHGFVALDRFRALVPHTSSILMDEATLLAHRGQWVAEDVQATALLSHLSAAESEMYEALRRHEFGDRVRLEQERIAYPAVQAALARLASPAGSSRSAPEP